MCIGALIGLPIGDVNSHLVAFEKSLLESRYKATGRSHASAHVAGIVQYSGVPLCSFPCTNLQGTDVPFLLGSYRSAGDMQISCDDPHL